ncbi:MAG: GDSL-type esterase/lipase family protein [Paludibacter sp.]|nr:GDSL-type esterase/lipase family protein [Paludibacter sp.]
MKKIYFIFNLVFLTSNICYSQINIDLSEYPFIDSAKNKIIIYNKPIYFNDFFNKIDTFLLEKKGKINILHIGASHVQGGYFTNSIRMNFDMLNGENVTSRGLIFPFKVANTNNPKNYLVNFTGKWTSERNVMRSYSMPLGIAGIAVATSDSNATISVYLNTDSVLRHRTFTRLILIGHNTDKQMITPIIIANQKEFFPYFFDEKTNAYTYELNEEADIFTLAFRNNDTLEHTFIVGGFIPENDMQGIVYNEIGVNGAAVYSYLNCENFESEINLIKPDLVVFGIGINDWVNKTMNEKDFINNYNRLIEQIRRISPHCAMIFITNNDSYRRVKVRQNHRTRYVYNVNTNGLRAQQAFYQLAKENNAAIWDIFSIMGGLHSMQQWELAGLAAKDKIHFSAKGYKLLGDLFFNALIEAKNN